MPLHYEKDGDIAVFTIENGSVNPTTPAMHKELFLALKDFLADPAIRCGIITGAGERGFCAGDDIKTPYHKGDTARGELGNHLWPHSGEGETPHDFAWSRDVLGLERFKPIIGAVNGWCLGQGMIYLLALTDIRIASTRAKFGFPEIAYGMGGAGGTSRLGLQLPHTVAMWMLLTGDAMDAEEALSHRLVNKIVAPESLMDEARQVAAKIARHPPEAVRIEMEAYYRGRELSKEDALAFTKHLYRLQRMGLREELVQPERFLYRQN
ncbi:enoyl-CoA hydratase/isomerase family protein [Microvirga sp. BT688]|uniref:enoyl-CoA hydratase/isomerase family protein n=1 Tax=Microvirga sp. TaxID=1873136 RepID=UPI00168933A8|nr:enoyl-CoA hydratase/isomerase family protein [Microvirga sp.]MBD2749191.1 enoyl-CoA hydratase/isomerase family protein [Microvirga sp.]